jgi:hypothetical protein
VRHAAEAPVWTLARTERVREDRRREEGSA